MVVLLAALWCCCLVVVVLSWPVCVDEEMEFGARDHCGGKTSAGVAGERSNRIIIYSAEDMYELQD